MGIASASACRAHLVASWRAAKLAPGTITNRLRAFDAVGGPHATLESVLEYLDGLPMASTRRTRLSDLRCCFRTLIHAGLMRSDPTLAVPRIRVPRWTPRPLDDDEIELLGSLPQEVWETVMFALYAGLRAAEIASLEANQLERWTHGWALRIPGKGGYVGVIPAHPRLVELMRGKRGRIYPGATPNSISHNIHYWFNKVGIEGGIHRCRHTFATRALEASGNDLLCVRDLLRHASVTTTQIYCQLPAGRMFEVMKQIA